MTVKFSLITAAVGAVLAFAVPAWGNHQYGDGIDGSQPATARVSPDALERAFAAKEKMLEAREQAVGTNLGTERVAALEARERAFAAQREVQLTTGQHPDWFERFAAARHAPRDPVVDDRFRIDPTSDRAPVAVTSGREIEWPQIGLGFGIGIVLMLGLYLVTRTARERQPAL